MKKILIICGESYELNSLLETIDYLHSREIKIDIVSSIKNLSSFKIPDCLSKKCNVVKEISEIYNFILCTGLIGDHLKIENQNLGFIGHGGLADCNSNCSFVKKMLEIVKKNNGYYLALNKRLLNESGCKGEVIGWPKTDRLLNCENLKNIKKKILITGHWSEGGLWHNIGLNLLYQLIFYKENYDITITMHPRMFNDSYRVKDYNLGKLIILFCDEFNFEYKLDFEISDVLKNSDIIISDISSLTCEISVMNKPIIWFKENNKYNDSKLEKLIKNATFVAYNTKDIIHFLKNDLLAKTKELKELSEYCYDNIGNSNNKILEFLNKFL